MMHRFIFGGVLAMALGASPLAAQIPISNPSLPAEEHLVYREKTGEKTGEVTQDLYLKTDGDRRWYEVSQRTRESDTLMRLDADTLFPAYSEVISRSPDSVIRRTNEVLSSSAALKANEVLIADFNALFMTLRGLPWGTFKSAKLVILGSSNGGQSFAMDFTVQGKETLRTDGNSRECFKAEMGMGGFFGVIMGKSVFWFDAAPPHVLVRYEGSSGPPGSPRRSMELKSYEVK